MPNPNLLGKYFGSLWICHDNREFEKLNKTAIDLLLNLGYGKQKSREIGSYIKRSYQLHAEIDDLISKRKNQSNKNLINNYKNKIRREMDCAFQLAGCKKHKKLSYHHSSWWIDFSFTRLSHKKLFYFLILWHLFALQLIKFKKLFPALLATYRLCLAGIYGHDKRNTKRLIAELTEYWKIALKYDSHPFMF